MWNILGVVQDSIILFGFSLNTAVGFISVLGIGIIIFALGIFMLIVMDKLSSDRYTIRKNKVEKMITEKVQKFESIKNNYIF